MIGVPISAWNFCFCVEGVLGPRVTCSSVGHGHRGWKNSVVEILLMEEKWAQRPRNSGSVCVEHLKQDQLSREKVHHVGHCLWMFVK